MGLHCICDICMQGIIVFCSVQTYRHLLGEEVGLQGREGEEELQERQREVEGLQDLQEGAEVVLVQEDPQERGQEVEDQGASLYRLQHKNQDYYSWFRYLLVSLVSYTLTEHLTWFNMCSPSLGRGLYIMSIPPSPGFFHMIHDIQRPPGSGLYLLLHTCRLSEMVVT